MNGNIHDGEVKDDGNIVVILPQGRLATRIRSANKQTNGATTTTSNNCTNTSTAIQCWAHTRSGHRCNRFVRSREGEPIPIPYCETHTKSGDSAVKVVSHPFAGKCLVARFDLPANYRLAFHGTRGRCQPCDREDRCISFYPPHPIIGNNYHYEHEHEENKNNGAVNVGKNEKNRNTSNKAKHATHRNRVWRKKHLRTNNYNGVLDPEGTGDVIQYAACPGPTERQNMRSTFQYWGCRNGERGGLEFITIEPISKNTQLCHWYGSGWWTARDHMKRENVGTTKYPAPKRRRKNELKIKSVKLWHNICLNIQK